MSSDGEENDTDADFNSGFDPAPPEKVTPTETKVEPAPKVETKDTAPAAAKVEPPKYRQITEAEFTRLDAAANKTTDFERQLSKAFGTLGDMQQVVKKLQSETPAGMTIDLPADVVAELEKDFPDIAPHVRTSLEKALKGIRGTGTATPVDPDAVQKLVSAATLRLETEALEDAHPTWREIVGAVDNDGKHDPDNEFRKWLVTQDAAYQHKINATNSAVVISRAIDKFLASKTAATTTPAPKVAARKDRIQAAIQPQGDGGQPSPSKTADDEFNEGFRSG